MLGKNRDNPVRLQTMQALVTGVGGFLGSYLAELLLDRGCVVYGAVRRGPANVACLKDRLSLLPCDVLDAAQVEAAVRESQPEVVFHLAAQSLPVLSWKDPEDTFRTNVFGTLNLLEAVRKASPAATVVVAGSSAEYGFASPEEAPRREDRPLRPASPYGVSKVAAGLLGHLYWHTYGLKVVHVRPFFVIGPRKTSDACSDFARGIVAVERGERRAVSVGNLEAVRDFLDVRDAVRGLWLLGEKGTPGEVYNLCSGTGNKVRELLDILVSMAERSIPVEQDLARLRPIDEPVIIGDNTRLRALGWSPQIPLDQTLKDILDYWRRSLGDSAGRWSPGTARWRHL
ncbi:MAG: GDP-mannose 4,6-dehydratase [Chloroflexota bacterium]|nr:GDP-mannose 4,6-dehydratase [Chloroflexota bacterium]